MVSDAQDRLLAGLLTGEQCLTREQLNCCTHEGLLSMVKEVDPAIKEDVRRLTYQFVAAELAHARVVKGLLDDLGGAGIDCLVFKGTALAYSLYEHPWHRSRVDTDLWVREEDVDAAFATLTRLGFEQQVFLPGRLAFGECAFDKTDRFGAGHTIDLHWRFNNSWLLTGAVDFEETWQERIPLRALGDQAWTCDNGSALFIACVHRAAHMNVVYELEGFMRRESDSTLWLYDIHLLVDSLATTWSETDWSAWAQKVVDRRFAKFVLSGLERARELFGTPVSMCALAKLREAQGQVSPDCLDSQVSAEWQSFLAVPGQRKFRFLFEQLFPASGYMRDRYGAGSLAGAYAKRIFSGLFKRLR